MMIDEGFWGFGGPTWLYSFGDLGFWNLLAFGVSIL